MPRYDYGKAMKTTIPAARAAVAQSLSEEHGMSGTDIARRLGIAQAAVSKYLSGKYSNDVKRGVGFIRSKGIEGRVVESILSGGNERAIATLIDKLAAREDLMDTVLRS